MIQTIFLVQISLHNINQQNEFISSWYIYWSELQIFESLVLIRIWMKNDRFANSTFWRNPINQNYLWAIWIVLFEFENHRFWKLIVLNHYSVITMYETICRINILFIFSHMHRKNIIIWCLFIQIRPIRIPQSFKKKEKEKID